MIIKRIFDLLISLILVLFFMPIFLLVAISLLIFGGKGSILFLQERAKKDGIPFKIFKFRTMVHNAEAQGAGLALSANDSRITGIGNILRKTSLDEIPQLFNVLKGEMSLVGPRPLPVLYNDRYSETQKRRLEVRPGITGWAQVNGRNKSTWEERFEMDIHYVDNQSLLFDLKILVLTITTVLQKDTSDGSGEVKVFEGNNKPDNQS